MNRIESETQQTETIVNKLAVTDAETGSLPYTYGVWGGPNFPAKITWSALQDFYLHGSHL